MSGFVYILASKYHGVLYTGHTNDIARRAFEHKSMAVKGFTRKYAVTRLVWFDGYDDIRDAIAQERRLKRWRREWKIALIEATNPDWRDLYEDLA